MSLQGGRAKGQKSLRRVAPLPRAVLREDRTMRQQCMARGLEANDMKHMALIVVHVNLLFINSYQNLVEIDLHTIYCHLYHMDVLSHLREHQLRSMCTSARYERHEANHIVFYPDSIATCWYILLSGSVFVKEHMYLA
eukprot:superscaffoldBa00000442_g4756